MNEPYLYRNKKNDIQRKLKGHKGRIIAKDFILDKIKIFVFLKTPKKLHAKIAMKAPREGCTSITTKQNHKL